MPRFSLKADPNYDPSEDWLDDNKGLPYMDFPNFFDALFELADMWAESTHVAEYVSLLAVRACVCACRKAAWKRAGGDAALGGGRGPGPCRVSSSCC